MEGYDGRVRWKGTMEGYDGRVRWNFFSIRPKACIHGHKDRLGLDCLIDKICPLNKIRLFDHVKVGKKQILFETMGYYFFLSKGTNKVEIDAKLIKFFEIFNSPEYGAEIALSGIRYPFSLILHMSRTVHVDRELDPSRDLWTWNKSRLGPTETDPYHDRDLHPWTYFLDHDLDLDHALQ